MLDFLGMIFMPAITIGGLTWAAVEWHLWRERRQQREAQ